LPLTNSLFAIAWLNIIAAANEQDKSGKLWGIREILNRHYAKYGRSFFSRYDYEEVSSEGAQKLVDHLNGLINSSTFTAKLYTSSATGTSFTVSNAYNFDYTDPIDKSVSKNQGQVVTFSDGSRVVWRLSGTGSQGATVRMYVERYVAPEAGEQELARDTGEGLQALIDVALEISNLKQFLGREQPTVITVSDVVFLNKRSTLSRRATVIKVLVLERVLQNNVCESRQIERRYLVCGMKCAALYL
jgi:phosphoglucomutase